MTPALRPDANRSPFDQRYYQKTPRQASQLKNVQRLLGCPRASPGSLSEAHRVFDADLLRGIIGELVEKLPPIHRNTSLDQIKGILTLVDGSLLPALPRLTAGPDDEEELPAHTAKLEPQS